MPIDAARLRAQLDDFRTRKAAIDSAVVAGRQALPVVIGLLNDRKESVRWSAIRILAEIADKRAVEPLIQLVERGVNAMDAANALRSITGEDFGENGVAWRRWASGQTGLKVAGESRGLSDRALIEAALRGLTADVSTRKGRYVVAVRLQDGRSQTVYVVFNAKDAEGEPIVWLYTPCCEAEPDKYEWALRQNLKLPYGAIGLARIDGCECFVMSNTHRRATVHPEDLAKSILTLASKGDAVERLLAGEDKR